MDDDGRTAEDGVAAHKRRLAELDAGYQRALGDARTADEQAAAAKRYLEDLDAERKERRDAERAAAVAQGRAAHPREWRQNPRTGEWEHHATYATIWREDKVGI